VLCATSPARQRLPPQGAINSTHEALDCSLAYVMNDSMMISKLFAGATKGCFCCMWSLAKPAKALWHGGGISNRYPMYLLLPLPFLVLFRYVGRGMWHMVGAWCFSSLVIGTDNIQSRVHGSWSPREHFAWRRGRSYGRYGVRCSRLPGWKVA